MKKLLKLTAIAALSLSALTACSNTEKPKGNECAIKIGVVTDTGGIDDKSFNQGTWEGVVNYAKETNLDSGCYKYLQSNDEADYNPNLSTFADEKLDIIVAPGFLFETALKEIGATYPNQPFVIIDSVVESGNVSSAVFKEQEPSFIVGVAAAMKAKQDGFNTVGFIGGMDFPSIQKFEAGFEQGVASVDPGMKILIEYVGSFSDPTTGSAIAQKMFADGAYVVYHAAGASGNGMIAEAKKLRENGTMVWAIGVDSDQVEVGRMSDGSSVVLTSALKDVGTAAQYFIKKVVDGTYTAETHVFDASNDGISFTVSNKEAMGDEIIAACDKVLADIKAGTIVPTEVPNRVK